MSNERNTSGRQDSMNVRPKGERAVSHDGSDGGAVPRTQDADGPDASGPKAVPASETGNVGADGKPTPDYLQKQPGFINQVEDGHQPMPPAAQNPLNHNRGGATKPYKCVAQGKFTMRTADGSLGVRVEKDEVVQLTQAEFDANPGKFVPIS